MRPEVVDKWDRGLLFSMTFGSSKGSWRVSNFNSFPDRVIAAKTAERLERKGWLRIHDGVPRSATITAAGKKQVGG